ncbi:MAG TPA: NADH-quinone oxidoreductase subunit L [Planctomycetota bacterium]
MSSLLWLIPVLPLAGFLANGLLKLPKPLVGIVGCAGPAAAFALSVMAALEAFHAPVAAQYFDWISVGSLNVSFGLQVDALSAVMILVVTGVGSLIHVYSIGYMHDDPGYRRYFAYLNLFMFSMLILVLGDSLLLLFVGWEGVGLCSYLLIGFWFQELKNADAGKKAFITNRIGDVGFILGLFCLWRIFGALDFDTLRAGAAKLDASTAALAGAAGLLLFIGATGKSAQIPLFVWLPDAMAGPTPVSALIHAATMVTAGVYMMARLWFLYDFTPDVLRVVGYVATATALLSGVIAVAQNDIKKILAYSTVSQLGFMFAGISAGHYSAGLFHVVTHAFFKALLFLGAGAVIHALHGEQDIRKMGGLGKKLPALTGCFIAGALALAGMPFTSGFFSKDAILASTSGVVQLALIATAGLTAFYTTRLCVIVFMPRHDDHHHDAHHELHKPGLTMLAPLAVLAVLSLVGGLLGGPLERALDAPRVKHHLATLQKGGDAQRRDARRLLATMGDHALKDVEAAGSSVRKEDVDFLREKATHAHHAHLTMMAVSGVIFLLGAGSAFVIYTRATAWLATLVAGPLKRLHALAVNKFYVDEIYEYTVVAPLRMGATVTWFVVDRLIIDGLCVNGAGKLVYFVGGLFRRTHSGSVNVSLAAFLLGAVGVLGWLLWSLGAFRPELWTAGFSR